MQLTEWRPSPPMTLPADVRRVLERDFDATITAALGPDEYVVRPGGVVGAVSVAGEVVTVSPKIDIDRVLFMVAYANDPYGWKQSLSSLGAAQSLVDGMAALFAQACEPLIVNGLLRDYRKVDVDGRVVRGKIRWGVQARRFAPVPIALRHEVHDDDIVENRILRQACEVLRRGGLSDETAPRVGRVWRTLRDLMPLQDALHLSQRIVWTRRNLHYRPAIELARLILGGDMVDVVGGKVAVQGFTLVMHEVFERFLRVALRTAWGASERDMPDAWSGRGLALDEAGAVPLKPDLGWADNGLWRFVGDAKYKKDDSGRGQASDIYQALAYALATGLPEATLFYAEGGQDRDHVIPAAGKVVRVRHFDLGMPPEHVLGQIESACSASSGAHTRG